VNRTDRPFVYRGMWKTRTFLGSGIALVAALATACGGSSSGGNTQSVGTGSGGSGSAITLTTHSGPDGKYLTDGSGRTVYIFAKDTSTKSTCSGDCAKEWPPVTTSGSPTASGGATGSMAGTTDRSDGSTQATYNGHPLYYFADDESAGDMNGQGEDDFGGLWTAVTPGGTALSAAEPSDSPSSSGGSSSEWG
jgi:predicted lipoprotein with Yx(FWY)xxD motif